MGSEYLKISQSSVQKPAICDIIKTIWFSKDIAARNIAKQQHRQYLTLLMSSFYKKSFYAYIFISENKLTKRLIQRNSYRRVPTQV